MFSHVVMESFFLFFTAQNRTCQPTMLAIMMHSYVLAAIYPTYMPFIMNKEMNTFSMTAHLLLTDHSIDVYWLNMQPTCQNRLSLIFKHRDSIKVEKNTYIKRSSYMCAITLGVKIIIM